MNAGFMTPENSEKIADCLERVADDHSGTFTSEDGFVVECAVAALRMTPRETIGRVRALLWRIEAKCHTETRTQLLELVHEALAEIARGEA